MVPPEFREYAPAKINLTLEVVGKLPSGFHALASLVAFASVGDEVVFTPGEERGVFLSGPFAAALGGAPNTLERVLELVAETAPHVRLGRVDLEKNLPVASGIGGGSADAAALLRAIRRSSGAAGATVDWREIAARVGADAPVCFESRALWMTGVGHGLAEVSGGVPVLAGVLANPMAAVPADKTARVFRALGAARLQADPAAEGPPKFRDRDGLLAFMRARGNDLEDAAASVVPETRDLLAALRATAGVEHAALSGAGPTCFAIFRDAATAEAARRHVLASHPAWWSAAVTIR